MKRAIALLLTFACLLTVSACGKKIYFDEEEYNSEMSESASAAEVSSSKQAEDISEAVENTLDEIGKTEKGKRLVVVYNYKNMDEYIVVEFKKGVSDSKYYYRYCKTNQKYETLMSVEPDAGFKIVDHDKNLRMIKYKNSDITPIDFDTYYELYARKDACTIIE